jgi:hypothetical protein
VDPTGIAVFVLLRGNDRLDFQLQQVLINPIRPMSLVAEQP